MARGPLTYWDINGIGGADRPFQIGRERCQRLILAVVACNAQILDSHSWEVGYGDPPCEHPHRAKVVFRVAIPEDQVERFAKIAGVNLSKPPRIQLGM